MADRYALVVGIAKYEAFTRLEKAAASALEVAHILQKYGQFRVDLDPVSQWLDAETPQTMGTWLTGDELWQKLESFFQNTARGGDALFYFCGHGFVVRDRYNPNQQAAYLATSDTTVTLENGQVINQNRGISFQNLVNLFCQSQLRSLVVLLDCCHAGSLLEESVVENFLGNPNRDCSYRLIAACRADESAYESSQKYTIFTDALIKALASDRADEEGQISDGRVWEFLRRELRGRVQKPVAISLRDPITLVTYDRTGKSTPETTPVGSNPYIGLLAFEETEADRFFGRDSASWDLINDLRDNRFLAVVGDSGSGKSSLVKAGLLPKLRTGQSLPGSDQWQIEPMTPGHNPDVRLQAILERCSGDHILLVFIDQFEEVFTQCDDEAEKRAFMRRITAAVTQPEGQIRFVITIRGDFLTRCGEYEIADLINASKPRGYIIKAMTQDELRDAIEKPAASHGVQFESHLVDRIIEDVESEPGALPLLQHALKELWRVCLADQSATPTLTWAAYEQIGGVAGALEKQADNLFNNFSTTEQAFTRRFFVQELVKKEGQTYTRRRATYSSLEKIAPSKALLDRVIHGFTSDRLLVTGILPQPDISQAPGQLASFVEIAHEALLEKWTRLKTWLQEDREKIDLLQQLRTNFDNWNTRYQQSKSALLMGALLANIEEKLDWKNLELEETEFVRKSLERRDQELQTQLEQERQMREAAEARAKAEEDRKLIEIEKGLEAEARAKAEAEKAQEFSRRVRVEKQRNRWLSGAAIGLAALATLTFGLKQQAEQRQQEAIDALVARPEQILANQDQLEALIESVKVLKQLKQIGGNQSSALARLQKVVYGVQERNRLEGHESGGIFAVSFSHDGQKIASAGGDGTVRIWDRHGNSLLPNPLLHDKARVWTVSFSYKDDLLASGDAAGRIRLWNSRDGKLLRLLPLQARQKTENPILKVSFSPDDRLLAAAVSGDQTIEIWRVADGQLVKSIPQGTQVNSVSFSPNGQMVAAGGEDGKVKLWSLDGNLLKVFTHGELVYDVAFNSDTILASGGKNKEVKLWRIADDKPMKPLSYGDTIYGIAFSYDRQLIAAGGDDKTIKIWRITDSQKVASLFNGNPVNSISFSPDNQTIASSDEKLIRLWHIFSNPPKDIKINVMLEDACQYLHEYLSTSKNLTQHKDSEVCENVH
jgi:WD40 repeat protein/energy-coupling factor transporter ATP-binding protein EcfA2